MRIRGMRPHRRTPSNTSELFFCLPCRTRSPILDRDALTALAVVCVEVVLQPVTVGHELPTAGCRTALVAYRVAFIVRNVRSSDYWRLRPPLVYVPLTAEVAFSVHHWLSSFQFSSMYQCFRQLQYFRCPCIGHFILYFSKIRFFIDCNCVAYYFALSFSRPSNTSMT